MHLARIFATVFLALATAAAGNASALEESGLTRAISLDGAWTLTPDPELRGVQERWGERVPPLPGNSLAVSVPSVWEKYLPGFHSNAWYQAEFAVPRKFGPRAILKIGAANYRAEGWLNGRHIGVHEGGYTPFEWDASSAIKPGSRNTLVILITHPASAGTLITDADLGRLPLSKETWYYPAAGIWGHVEMESRSDPWIEQLSVTPDEKASSIRVVATIAGTGQPFRGVLTLSVGERHERIPVRLKEGPPDGQTAVIEKRIPMRDAKKWSPEAPAVYRLTANLSSGFGVVEKRFTTFGLRAVDWENGVFMLNGRPRPIRGILYQPNFPAGLSGAPDAKMAVKDLADIKAMGFNLVRAHLKPLTEEQLEWCDLHGLMVYAETPLAWMNEPDGEKAFQVAAREIRELVAAQRNHPSVVIWGISNENGKFAGEFGERLLRLAGQMDPSRPVIDVSGWAMNIFPEGGWVNETHLLRPGASQAELLEDNHHYLRSPAGKAEWNILRNLGEPGKMGSYESAGYGPVGGEKIWYDRLASSKDSIFVSEFGCGGLGNLEASLASFGAFRAAEHGVPPSATALQDETDLGSIWKDLSDGLSSRKLAAQFGGATGFAEACQRQQAEGVRAQTEALRLNPRVSGLILTQYNDVSWECSAGAVDVWRNHKRVAEELPRLNAPILLVVRPESRGAESGTRVRVDFMAVSDTPLPRKTVAEYRVVRTTQPGRVWAPLTLSAGSSSTEIGDLPGRGQVVVEARLREGKKVLAFGSAGIHTVDASMRGQISFALYGEWPEGRRKYASCLIPAEYSKVAIIVKPSKLAKGELGKALDMARNGGKAVLMDLEPADLVELAKFRDFPVKGELRKTVSTFSGWFHWFRKMNLMAGLPGMWPDSPGQFLAGEPMADLIPIWSLPEPEWSATVFAGATGINIRIMEPQAPNWHWCADIYEIPYGKGKLAFCQYRLLTAIETDPTARMLFYRLLLL